MKNLQRLPRDVADEKVGANYEHSDTTIGKGIGGAAPTLRLADHGQYCSFTSAPVENHASPRIAFLCIDSARDVCFAVRICIRGRN